MNFVSQPKFEWSDSSNMVWFFTKISELAIYLYLISILCKSELQKYRPIRMIFSIPPLFIDILASTIFELVALKK